MTTTLGRKVLLAASVVVFGLAVGCDEAVTPAPETPPPAPAAATPDPAPAATQPPETDLVKATERRHADLLAIKAAIDAHQAETGKFPYAIDGLKGVLDRGADWVPGLAPKYITALPRDPAMSNDRTAQYLYVSDGNDFKLIVHNVGATCGPAIEKEGIKIDPARVKADGGCWAYGFWTAAYEKF